MGKIMTQTEAGVWALTCTHNYSPNLNTVMAGLQEHNILSVNPASGNTYCPYYGDTLVYNSGRINEDVEYISYDMFGVTGDQGDDWVLIDYGKNWYPDVCLTKNYEPEDYMLVDKDNLYPLSIAYCIYRLPQYVYIESYCNLDLAEIGFSVSVDFHDNGFVDLLKEGFETLYVPDWEVWWTPKTMICAENLREQGVDFARISIIFYDYYADEYDIDADSTVYFGGRTYNFYSSRNHNGCIRGDFEYDGGLSWGEILGNDETVELWVNFNKLEPANLSSNVYLGDIRFSGYNGTANYLSGTSTQRSTIYFDDGGSEQLYSSSMARLNGTSYAVEIDSGLWVSNGQITVYYDSALPNGSYYLPVYIASTEDYNDNWFRIFLPIVKNSTGITHSSSDYALIDLVCSYYNETVDYSSFAVLNNTSGVGFLRPFSGYSNSQIFFSANDYSYPSMFLHSCYASGTTSSMYIYNTMEPFRDEYRGGKMGRGSWIKVNFLPGISARVDYFGHFMRLMGGMAYDCEAAGIYSYRLD